MSHNAQDTFRLKENIQTSLDNLLQEYTSRHSKVLPVRFDIRYPDDYHQVGDNIDISRCIAKTVQKLKRDGLDPKYIWVRERESSNNQHYHCLILLNGHKSQNPHRVFSTVKQLWGSTIGAEPSGLIDHCTKSKNGTKHPNGIMLRKQDADYEEKKEQVMKQISYLAKVQGKGEPLDKVRDFGMSRIK